MSEWEQYFESQKDSYICIEKDGAEMGNKTVEEFYQVFKARIIEELGLTQTSPQGER